ncbi:potassium channel subfamily K member 4 isoform X3 [Oreochromis niloticus]|uniref:potassium channel subfamily K member 4 isoform X3 n=1 Tax=Oreochromis niloticus TaxID=8128 RepID=UPI00067450BA|nr:potassium channel subfamily K member 4-like isoform X3 [Oreochromis niloticus]
MRCTTLTTLLVGVMLYLVMGAFVFVTLEKPKETLAHEKLLQTKKDFLTNNSCVTESDFHKLVKGLMSAVEAGLDVSRVPANLTTRWDIASACFFCGTIITTIGFGNLSPRTWYGQLFCVCYALVGIPMFGILLAGVGDHMGRVLRRAVAKIETLFLVRMKRKVGPTTVRVTSAVLSILIGCLIFLAVPTVVFQKVEDWSFLESLYFVVITLTTVGFGDYVPVGGIEDDSFFKLLVLLWIVFGLAYFASILTMIGNWLRVLSKRTRAEMEELRAHATDWTQSMSKDFRIPNPLEFNDPFLLQRRRWKRSERRRIRRGAQGTLGYRVRGGPENGHLPRQWAGLSSSMRELQDNSSVERARGTNSKAQLDVVGACMQEGSLSGSESAFDSRSDGSSVSFSYMAPHKFQPCRTISSMEEGSVRLAHMDTSERKDELIPVENCESAPNNSHNQAPDPSPSSRSSPVPTSLPEVLLPSPDITTAPSPSCQLLDFFGENLAYIDESSDTLSDRPHSTSEEKRRRPRKPKKKSIRRQLSHRWSSLQVRRPSSDMQPPSHPPTPPPASSLSDLSLPENQTDAAPAL